MALRMVLFSSSPAPLQMAIILQQAPTAFSPHSGLFPDRRFPGVDLQYRLHGPNHGSYSPFTGIMEALIIIAYDGPFILFTHLTAKSAPALSSMFPEHGELRLEVSALPSRNLQMNLVGSVPVMAAEIDQKSPNTQSGKVLQLSNLGLGR